MENKKTNQKPKDLLEALSAMLQPPITAIKDWGKGLAGMYPPPPITDKQPVIQSLEDMFNPQKSVFYAKFLDLMRKTPLREYIK